MIIHAPPIQNVIKLPLEHVVFMSHVRLSRFCCGHSRSLRHWDLVELSLVSQWQKHGKFPHPGIWAVMKFGQTTAKAVREIKKSTVSSLLRYISQTLD
jgi:hypothetical protein